jgi:hypothetical protein
MLVSFLFYFTALFAHACTTVLESINELFGRRSGFQGIALGVGI